MTITIRHSTAAILIALVGVLVGCGGSGESQHEREARRATALLEKLGKVACEGKIAHANALHIVSKIHFSHGPYLTTKREREEANPLLKASKEQQAIAMRKQAQIERIERQLVRLKESAKEAANPGRLGREAGKACLTQRR